MKNLVGVRDITKHITCEIFGIPVKIEAHYDRIRGDKGRVFLQSVYNAPCTKTGEDMEWKGRKYYLSDYMTDDEIVKTAYTCFKTAVEHEIMEGFKFDGVIVFNPHVDFLKLMEISHHEIERENHE